MGNEIPWDVRQNVVRKVLEINPSDKGRVDVYRVGSEIMAQYHRNGSGTKTYFFDMEGNPKKPLI